VRAARRTVDEYSRKLGARPKLEAKLWPGKLDQIEVEDVARDIVEIALELRPKGAEASPFVVRNHCTNGAFEVSNMQQVIKEREGLELEVWSVEKWLEKTTQMDMEVVGLYYALNDRVEGSVSPSERKERRGVRFKMRGEELSVLAFCRGGVLMID
jgi:hypothetical protein